MNDLIITASSTGNKWRRENSHYVPITPEEIIEDIVHSYNAGATVAHVHARTESGEPSGEPRHFRKIIEAVRKRCGILIQISISEIVGYWEKKLPLLLELEPDYVYINLSQAPYDEVSMALERIKRSGIKPWNEVRNVRTIEITREYIEKGLIEEPAIYEVYFDSKKQAPLISDLEELINRVKALPKQSIWSVAHGEENQLGLGGLAIILGGNIRVGLEDNLFHANGVLAQSSAEFVDRVAKVAKYFERNVAAIDATRRILTS